MKYLALILLTGCSVFQNPAYCIDRGDGLCWYRNPVQIETDKVVWKVDINASALCGYDRQFEHASCMIGRDSETRTCHILSVLTVQQAKQTWSITPIPRKQTIYEHEKEHCNGWLHTNNLNQRGLAQ